MTRRAPPLRDAFLGIAIAFVGLRLFDVPPWNQSVDAYAYWRPLRGGGPYGDGSTAGAIGAYLYSPAFKFLFLPLGALPWHVFNVLWNALNLGSSAPWQDATRCHCSSSHPCRSRSPRGTSTSSWRPWPPEGSPARGYGPSRSSRR